MSCEDVATPAELSSSLSVVHREKVLHPRSFTYFRSVNQDSSDFSELNEIIDQMNQKITAKNQFLESKLGQGVPDYDDFLMDCIQADDVLTEPQFLPFDFMCLSPSEYLHNELAKHQRIFLPLTKSKKLAFIRHISDIDLQNDSRMDYQSMWGPEIK